MGLLDALKAEIDKVEQAELIDGQCPAALVEIVDLEVAGQNLVVERQCDNWQHDPPQPTSFQRWDSRWALIYPSQHDYRIVDERSLKVMRARFLLMNGWYYRHFSAMPHSAQCRVYERFLQHTFGVPPKPDSPLGKLLSKGASDD